MSKTGKRKSIGQQMAGCKTVQGSVIVAKRWATDWYNEQAALLRKLHGAIEYNDHGEIAFYLQQLEAVNEKRHGALPRVFDRIAKFVEGSKLQEG